MIKRFLKHYCRSYGTTKLRKWLVRFIEYMLIGCELCAKRLNNTFKGHEICKLGNMWICGECNDARK